MTTINLEGLRILNTRPEAQADSLNQMISAAHGLPLSCPALGIVATAPTWLAHLPEWTEVDQALFTSVNAVNQAFQCFAHHRLTWPSTIHTTAIGQSTAGAMRALQVRVDNIPEFADSEHLLKLPAFQHVQDKTLLLFKGEGGRTLIAETLTARGARLIELAVYRRTMPCLDQSQLNAWWRNKEVDIILFTSQQAMHNIFCLFGNEAHAWLSRIPCIVISERLAEAATLLGMQTIITCRLDTIMTTLQQFNKGLTHGKK